MPVAAAEYTVSRTYLDWLVTLPWQKRTEEVIDLPKTKGILDADHSGLEKAKDRILEYLADNPDANDTSEGITEWWLLEREIRDRQAEVERALSELVAEGLVIAHRGAGARTRYRLNQDRAEEVERLFERRRE